MSHDHKPQNDIETARINKTGHFVEDDRVDGNLALSRAIGDYQYKDKLSLQPED
jgi:protein phosphatase 2C family protein 2/3